MKKRIGLKIDSEIIESMKKTAKETHRSLSGFVRYAIENELNKENE